MSVSRREYIAVHASDREIDYLMPSTLGGTAEALNERGIIKYDRDSCSDITRAYKASDVEKLRAVIRYEYADSMIKASGE